MKRMNRKDEKVMMPRHKYSYIHFQRKGYDDRKIVTIESKKMAEGST